MKSSGHRQPIAKTAIAFTRQRCQPVAMILALCASLLSVGCRREAPPRTASSPRIVSFSPAITDMLYGMGLGDHVVGVTTYCKPPGKNPPPVVGNRFRVDVEAVLATRPDVILTQQNPDDFAAVVKIDPHIKVCPIRMETLDDIAKAIERIGKIAGLADSGRSYKRAFLAKLAAITRRAKGKSRPRVLFLIGYDRSSTGGAGTFIDDMIRIAGGIDAATARGYTGWKTLNRENILAMSPDVLLCQVGPSQESAALKYLRTIEDLPAVRRSRVFIVTDSRWTIPSMRSAQYAEKLFDMIHPYGQAKGPEQ